MRFLISALPSLFLLLFFSLKTFGADPCPSALSGSETLLMGGALAGAAISDDCRLLLAASPGANGVGFYRFIDGVEEKRLLPPEGEHLLSADFSPDGQSVLFVSGPEYGPGLNRVWIWSVSTGRSHPELFRTTGQSATFDSTGHNLLLVVGNQVEQHDARTGALLSRYLGHLTEITLLRPTADGRWIAAAAHDGSVKIWDTRLARETYQIPSTGQSVQALDFSPDGKELMLATDRVRFFDLATAKVSRDLGPETGALNATVLSRDGSKLLLTTRGDRLTLLDAYSGETLWLGSLPGLNKALFSPDGRWVIGFSEGTVVRWRVTD